MMSLRSWVALLVVYALYLVLGGYSFRALENPPDCKNRDDGRRARNEAREKVQHLYDSLDPKLTPEFTDLLTSMENASEGRLFGMMAKVRLQQNITDGNEEEEEPDCFTWNLYNSVFFSFTAVTTIGYGHLSPRTDEGKLLCIFYSLLGVPLNGILIGGLAAYFSKKLNNLTNNAREAKSEAAKIMLLSLDVVIFMIPGVAVFLLIPSIAFCFIEDDWNYLDSFYYSFITLTTIGFGDFVAGRDPDVLDDLNNWDIVYEIGLIVWIIFGLGYIFMVITVITDGLRKPVKSFKRFQRDRKGAIMAKVMAEIVDLKMKQQEMEVAPTMNMEGSPCLSSRRGSDPGLILGVAMANGGDALEQTSPRRSRSLTQLIDEANGEEQYDNLAMAEGVNPAKLAEGLSSIMHDLVDLEDGHIGSDKEEETEEDDEDDEEEEERANRDTITSLRHFIEASRVLANRRATHQRGHDRNLPNMVEEVDGKSRPRWTNRSHSLEERSRPAAPFNNMSASATPAPSSPTPTSPPMTPSGAATEPWRSRFSSISSTPASAPASRFRTASVSSASAISAPGAARQRRLTPAARALPPGANSSGMSVPDILRHTTLEEFLQAAENVRRRSELELRAQQEEDEDRREASRKNSDASMSGPARFAGRFRKLSAQLRRGSHSERTHSGKGDGDGDEISSEDRRRASTNSSASSASAVLVRRSASPESDNSDRY